MLWTLLILVLSMKNTTVNNFVNGTILHESLIDSVDRELARMVFGMLYM